MNSQPPAADRLEGVPNARVCSPQGGPPPGERRLRRAGATAVGKASLLGLSGLFVCVSLNKHLTPKFVSASASRGPTPHWAVCFEAHRKKS